MESETKTVYNFSAGPCCLPKVVLKKAQEELMDWHGTGVSVMEMSHRSKEFISIVEQTEADLRKLLDIPDNYKVLFFQGGASLQFTMIAKNLMGKNNKANYLVTGSWSQNAFKDAKKLGEITEVIKPQAKFTGCPDFSEWTVTDDAAYFHFCENETIHGVEFNNFPYEELKDQLIVCDMSSNFCTRKIEWSRYGIVYAGAQKNLGPAGLCVVVAREDLLGSLEVSDTTSMLSWSTQQKASNQMYNTPCCWAIYMAGLNIAYMLEKGLDNICEEAKAKSDLLYNYIDGSDGYYTNPVDIAFRSRSNIPFRVKCEEELEKKFLKEAAKANLIELAGHRSVGGCRASIYNAMPIEGVEALVSFMKKFREENP